MRLSGKAAPWGRMLSLCPRCHTAFQITTQDSTAAQTSWAVKQHLTDQAVIWTDMGHKVTGVMGKSIIKELFEWLRFSTWPSLARVSDINQTEAGLPAPSNHIDDTPGSTLSPSLTSFTCRHSEVGGKKQVCWDRSRFDYTALRRDTEHASVEKGGSEMVGRPDAWGALLLRQEELQTHLCARLAGAGVTF